MEVRSLLRKADNKIDFDPAIFEHQKVAVERRTAAASNFGATRTAFAEIEPGTPSHAEHQDLGCGNLLVVEDKDHSGAGELDLVQNQRVCFPKLDVDQLEPDLVVELEVVKAVRRCSH